MSSVNKGLKIRIYPTEDIIPLIHQYIGNARFTWNKILEMYKKLYKSSKDARPTLSTFNKILNELKEEFPFLREGESTSLQQVCRDLVQAFNKFFKENNGFPKFKAKKHTRNSFRLQNNNNSIRIENNKIKLPKLGWIKFKTSKEYKETILNSKINNVTVEFKNGKYYAVVNVETTHKQLPTSKKSVGIDMGLKTFATLSNGLKIANLDVTYEEEMIKKYQRSLSRKKHDSNNYRKELKKYWKWIDKKTNKIQDYIDKISHEIVLEYQTICMETLNIKGMMKNNKLSSKLQRISISKFVDTLKYKSSWNKRNFIQVDRFYPSSKLCSICGYKFNDLTLDMRKWTCPDCNTTHDRDVNAAINILQEGLNILSKKYHNN